MIAVAMHKCVATKNENSLGNALMRWCLLKSLLQKQPPDAMIHAYTCLLVFIYVYTC